MSLFDLQINGAQGVDFSDPHLSEDQVRNAFQWILANGTTKFLPTIITSAPSAYEQNIRLLSSIARESEFAGAIPGLHLEGPFLSPVKGAIGAHNPEWVTDPNLEWLDMAQEASEDSIVMVTLAPERSGAIRFIEELRARRIIPALGHSLASYAEVHAAEQAGALAWTHFGNGLPQLIDRHRNPLWAALGTQMTLTLIGDGHHVPTELISALLSLKGPEKLVLVSDASPLCGCQPGTYDLWGNAVRLEPDGSLRNPDTGYFCGSSFTLSQCVCFLQHLEIVDHTTLQTLTWNNPQHLLQTVSR